MDLVAGLFPDLCPEMQFRLPWITYSATSRGEDPFHVVRIALAAKPLPHLTGKIDRQCWRDSYVFDMSVVATAPAFPDLSATVQCKMPPLDNGTAYGSGVMSTTATSLLRVSQAGRYTPEDWATRRQKITTLYIYENKPLREVMRIMREEAGLAAT